MTGRNGLTWVTALTIASLLLGGGALNALAEGRGNGNGGGNGKANAAHQQQQQSPAQVHRNDDKHDAEQQVAPAKHDDDDAAKASLERGRGPNKDLDVEDLVTGPDRVTGEDRPGLGCGDDNHEHTGAPGNPDKECKDDHGIDDADLTVATADGS
jgi:hypothetical protein